MNKEKFEYALGLLYFLDSKGDDRLRPLKNLMLTYMQRRFGDFKAEKVLWLEEVKLTEARMCFDELVSHTGDFRTCRVIGEQLKIIRELTKKKEGLK